MRRKPPAMRSIGIDLNRRSVDGFECGYPVERHHGCALAFLGTFPFRGRERVYCDPPYVPYVLATRRGPRRDRFDFTDGDPVALLGLLRSLPCSVMVSGYPSALYDAHLSDGRALAVPVNNQAGVVTEKLGLSCAPLDDGRARAARRHGRPRHGAEGEGDGTGQPAHGHRHGIQPGRRVPEVRPRPARAAAPGTRARSPTACRGPCSTVPASGPAPSTGSSPTCSPCAAPPRWCGR